MGDVGDVPPPNDSWRDDELVSVAQVRIEGRKSRAWAAFEVLYQRHGNNVYQSIYRVLLKRSFPDPGLAQELTHDAFVKAWEKLPEKKLESPFEGWITRIGINEARQYIRKQRRTINQDAPQLPPGLSPADADQPLIDDDLRMRIERVKARLTKQQLKVFTMHYEQGMSLKEIAEVLKLKQATIWQTLWRANEHFKREWLKEGNNDDFPFEA